jgi:hypothetical protein
MKYMGATLAPNLNAAYFIADVWQANLHHSCHARRALENRGDRKWLVLRCVRMAGFNVFESVCNTINNCKIWTSFSESIPHIPWTFRIRKIVHAVECHEARNECVPALSQEEGKRLLAKFANEARPVLAVSGQHPGLASIASRSFFLSGQLLLGNLNKTVVVVGNAPHDRPSFLVCHLIGNPCELPLHESANA